MDFFKVWWASQKNTKYLDFTRRASFDTIGGEKNCFNIDKNHNSKENVSVNCGVDTRPTLAFMVSKEAFWVKINW